MLTYNNLIYEDMSPVDIKVIDFNKTRTNLELKHKLIDMLKNFQDEEDKYIQKN